MAPNPPDLSDPFFTKWVAMCRRLDVAPLDPIRVAYSESGCTARAHNPGGNAVGLVQFMPQTLANLGWHGGWAEFAALSAEEQVPFAEAYFRQYAHGRGGSPQLLSDAHCYVTTFLPALLPHVIEAGDAADDYVLCAAAGPLAWAYRDNKGLDADGDGRITVGDLAAHLAKVCRGARYDAIVARLEAAQAADDPPEPASEPTQIVHPDVDFGQVDLGPDGDDNS